ncbi:angio-associated migratory cell protein-like [Odontomachus brunneus]|uniref:angio-associated migratory cell protein-like n=1 Tax=Odontomachus brunneus TaxID=486640 RepID=UPI0013F27377|nr:angio-associated migratory cell protein-like [Odontomachus brunneus]
MYIWDTNTGNNINIIRCGYNCRSVTFAEFNHDGTYIATASYGEEGFIRVWEVSSKTNFDSTLIDELALVKWHHSANILLAMNNDGDTYIFNFLSKEEVTKELINANEIISPKCGLICPDGKFVVGCKFGPKNKNYYRENEMLYASTFRLIRSLNLNYNYEEDIRLPISEGYKDDIISIDCDVNNKLLISTSKDGKTRLSAPHNGELIAVLQNLNFGKHDYCIEDEQKSKKHNDCTKDEQESKSNKDWPNTVAFCRDPTLPLAASGTYNGKLFIWDVSKQILKYTIHIYPGRPITKILWKTNSTILFLSTSDGIIGCVDAKTGKYLWLCKGQIWIEDLYMSK